MKDGKSAAPEPNAQQNDDEQVMDVMGGDNQLVFLMFFMMVVSWFANMNSSNCTC